MVSWFPDTPTQHVDLICLCFLQNHISVSAPVLQTLEMAFLRMTKGNVSFEEKYKISTVTILTFFFSFLNRFFFLFKKKV